MAGSPVTIGAATFVTSADVGAVVVAYKRVIDAVARTIFGSAECKVEVDTQFGLGLSDGKTKGIYKLWVMDERTSHISDGGRLVAKCCLPTVPEDALYHVFKRLEVDGAVHGLPNEERWVLERSVYMSDGFYFVAWMDSVQYNAIQSSRNNIMS